MSFEPGDVIADRYRVVSRLGEGGMGAVFVVEHVHMHKRMALKVLHADVQNPEIQARFEREAMAAAHIDHPNVAIATDFGHTASGQLFMVMEYIDGASLRSALEAGAMPEARVLGLTRQIASALSKAHELGVVHRDLKPENVMLVRKDDGEHVKVLDFGIAKVEIGQITGAPGQALTQIGAVFGTPEYMAPEQAQGQPVDGRADLYALGVMMFEMLTGARPFDADDHVQLLIKHVTEPPPPLPPRVSTATEALVLSLLAKEPRARPASARDVVSAIDAALAETPAPVSIAVASLAKTQLPEAAPSPPERSAALRASEIAKKIPPAARVAILGAVALAPFLLISLVLHHGRAEVSAPEASTPTLEDTDRAPEPELAKARALGSQPLESLFARYPKDARVGRSVASAYASEARFADAASAIERTVAIDPSAASDPEMLAIARAAIESGSPNDADAAIRLATGALGASGVDLLIDLSSQPKLANKPKVDAALAAQGARAHASPAAAVVLELRATKRCDERHDLLARAAADGDARALAILKPMQRASGCGFLGRRDCWPCMRKDTALDDAVRALEAKR